MHRLLLVLFSHVLRESQAGSRPKTFRPFAGLSFLDLQHNDWLGNSAGSRARRMMETRHNYTSLEWDRRAHKGSHVGSDGAQVHYHAEGRPHRRYTHIFSVDLERGISHVFCHQLGGRNVGILVQGSSQVLQSLQDAVRFANEVGGQALLVGSEGWGCDHGYHWYAELDRVNSELRGGVQFSAKLLEFQEVFEDLEISFSLRPPGASTTDHALRAQKNRGFNSSAIHADGRRLGGDEKEKMFKEVTAGTEYSFNWDWENQRPEKSMLSLLGAEKEFASVSAGVKIECVDCFARAVGSLDVRYSYNLLKPRIYVALSGNAEVHGWVEVTAHAHAYEQEWDRVIASYEMPTIHFSCLGLPVSMAPFTQLRSLTTMSSGRLLGSMRGGFGARGHVIGTFQMNTKDWAQLPEGAEGVEGIDANLDVNFGTKLVTPSFAFEAENTDFTFRLIPSVGVRLWRSLSVELKAEGYIGTQIIRKNGDFRFEDAAGGSPEGVLYIRPEEIANLVQSNMNVQDYDLEVKVNGEVSQYEPLKDHEFVSYRDNGGDEVENFFNFASSKLPADKHMNFATEIRRNLVEAGKFSLSTEMAVNGKTYKGKLQENRNKECEEVDRSDYTMLKCDFYLDLEETSEDKRLGDLKLVVFWVPKNANFLPTGVEGLYFIHPPRAVEDADVEEKNLPPAVWACGETYQLAWALDPEEVMRVEKTPDSVISQMLNKFGTKKYYDNSQANPCFEISLSIVDGEALDIKPGVKKVKKCDLSYPFWSFDWMHMPERAAGHRVRFTATWNNMENQHMSKEVEVNVKDPQDVDFALTYPKEKDMLQAWEDLILEWRLSDAVDGRVSIQVRDGSTWELMHKKKDLDATKKKHRIAWLHLRAEAALNRAVILLVTFKNVHNGRPVTVLRHLDVKLPPNVGHRRLVGESIRESMFKSCEPTAKYSMFGGLDVSGHVWQMGKCENEKVYCPEGEIVGGNHKILDPEALSCKDANGGGGWCSGDIYSCSHGKTPVIERPVVALQLSHRMETIPSFPQLEEIKKSIALAISLMPEDIDLTNTSALMEVAPSILFQVVSQSDIQITPELIQSVIDAGQLSFTDGNFLAPLIEKVKTGGRRMNSNPRMLACETEQRYSPLGVTLATDDDVPKSLCALNPLSMNSGTNYAADVEGLEIVGVTFKKPSMTLKPGQVADRMQQVDSRLSSLESSNTFIIWVLVLQCLGIVSMSAAWFAHSKGLLGKRELGMHAPTGMEMSSKMSHTPSGPPMPQQR